MPDSIMACVIAADAMLEAPNPRCCMIALTFLTAGDAHAGISSPSPMPDNNDSSWYLTVPFSSNSSCAATIVASGDNVACDMSSKSIKSLADKSEEAPVKF